MNGALIRRGLAAVCCVSLAWAALHAEEQGPPAKGKGTIEVDLSKLPPDVVKQLLKLTAEQAPAPAPKSTSSAKPADKKDDDGGKGPPAEAKGLKLAQFITGQLGKGLTGDKLAEAINKERAKLGLTDDDKDDAPAPSKGKGEAPAPGKGKGKDKD